QAHHLGKSISFFDPDRDSDRKIVPELILKLSEADQWVPEFLKKYTDGSQVQLYNGDHSSRNRCMRSGDDHTAGAAHKDWD
ncbi:unnamed protein product, partial [Rotaria sordida]